MEISCEVHRDSEQSRAKRVQEGDLFTPTVDVYVLLALSVMRQDNMVQQSCSSSFADPYARNKGHQNGPSITFQIEESVGEMSR